MALDLYMVAHVRFPHILNKHIIGDEAILWHSPLQQNVFVSQERENALSFVNYFVTLGKCSEIFWQLTIPVRYRAT